VIGEPGGPAEAERAADQRLVAADRDIGTDLEQLVLDLLIALLRACRALPCGDDDVD
jgi:hypothetical protein